MRKIEKTVVITTYGDFTKTKTFFKKLWKMAKPYVKDAIAKVKPVAKKFVQKVIVSLHGLVSKLEKWLLEKIDEVEIE